MFDLGPLSPDLRYILQPLVTFDGCPNGTLYSSRFTSTKASCVGCSRGNYLQGTQCVKCPRGQYTELDIAISCDTCPPGFSTPTTGAESKDQCKEFCTPGYFSPTGFTPCQPCPAGGYQSRDQGVTCDLCPAGTWTVFAAAKSRNDCVAADVKLTANASLTLSLTSPQGPVTLITWLNLQTNCSLSLVLGLTIPNVAPPAPVTLAAITEGAEDSLDQALLADGRYFQISAKQWTRLTMVMSIEGGSQMLAVYNGSQRVYSTSLPPLNTTFTVTITMKPLRGTGLVSGMHGQVGEWSGQQIAMSSSTCMDHLDNTTLTWTPHPVSIITPSRCDAVDACASSPCGPHGQCEDTQAGHLCHCQQGWSGDACQVAPDACYQHQCQNGARCVVAGQNYSCECPEDWSGHLCQLEKVHGDWGEWGRWSNCSARCKGQHHRQRQCNNPVPASGGRPCSGVASESRSCGDSQCAEDGAWSLWVPWSTCSATCGGGGRRRSRRCDNPAPKNGGANCGGPNLYIESCAIALCPIHGGWGNWLEWSPCSVTCGDGTQSRDRSCDSPVPANEGQPCQGSSNQTRPCGLAKCPVCSELYELDGTTFNCSEKTDPYRKTCKVTCTRGYTTVHRPEYTCGQETGYLWPFERASVKVDAKHAIMYCQHELTPKTLSLTTNTVLKPDAKCEQRDKIEPQVANNLEKLPCRRQDKCKTKVTTTCGSPSSPSGTSRRRRETESVMVKVEFTADLGPSFVLNGSDPSDANKFIENFKVVDQSAAQIALNGSIFSVTVDNVTITPDVSKSSYTTNIACSPGATGTNGGGCVNCPPGYYEKEGLCEVCPLGQYQDQPGSTSCRLCPSHTTWDTTGASQRSQCLDTTKENATREPEKKDHTGIIIGAVVGSFVAVAILVIIVVCWLKYKGKACPSSNAVDPTTKVFDNRLYEWAQRSDSSM